jgi:hypothetical protein
MSLRQATHPHTSEFCNTLIRYGFSLAQPAAFRQLSVTELVPDITMSELRSEITKADRSSFEQVHGSLRVGFVHLSLDAATMNGHSMSDVILLHNDPRREALDFVLYKSVEVTTGTLNFYASETFNVIKSLLAKRIRVLSIVGDG